MIRKVGTAWLVALVGMTGGCFTATANRLCDAGTEGCSCLDLQCEAGLECIDAICRPINGTDGTTSESTTSPTTTTSDTTSTTTTDPTTTGTSSTTDPTTGASSTTDPTGTSTGQVELCGNGVLDPDEECDGTPGCTACELDNYDCNPLTNAPCTEGFKCSFVADPLNYECLVFSNDPPGQHGAESCFYDGSAHDEWCDVSLACAAGQITTTCDLGGCCVEYCDLLDANFTCQTAGEECRTALGVGVPEGLGNLGWCITP